MHAYRAESVDPTELTLRPVQYLTIARVTRSSGNNVFYFWTCFSLNVRPKKGLEINSLTPLQLETYLGTNLLDFSIRKDFGALKGSREHNYARISSVRRHS